MDEIHNSPAVTGDSGRFGLWMKYVSIHRLASGDSVPVDFSHLFLRLWDNSETRSNTSRSVCITLLTLSIACITVV